MRERAVPVLCELASRRDCATGSLDVESASRGMLASASRGIVLDMYNSLVLWLSHNRRLRLRPTCGGPDESLDFSFTFSRVLAGPCRLQATTPTEPR